MSEAFISRSRCAIRNRGWRWHMFEEKREAVMAIEAALLRQARPASYIRSLPR
jgi:hypothetical protein